MEYMVDFYKKLREMQFLPLFTVHDLKHLDDVEDILVNSNIPIIEITFRSDLALEAIKKLSKNNKILVGAGTVRTLQQAKQAIEYGAKFIVSPAVIPEIIEYCIRHKVPILPGAATPSEIQMAVHYGIQVIKYFPADLYGGLKGIQALSGPFYDISFVPTGGIDEGNYQYYLQHDQVLAVGGSFIISEKLLKDKGKSEVEKHIIGMKKTVDSKL